MFPGSTIAALLLLALVPGYLFLRLSESARRPREDSALSEVLEVFAVGAGTSGLACLGFALLWPARVSTILAASPPLDAREVRNLAQMSAALFALAIAIAAVLAWIVRMVTHESYARNGVWAATLGLSKRHHVPRVMVRLRDGRSVAGTLHAYTTLDGDQPRDVALTRPLELTSASGSSSALTADYVIVGSEQIDLVGFVLDYDQGAAHQDPLRMHPRLRGLRTLVSGRP